MGVLDMGPLLARGREVLGVFSPIGLNGVLSVFYSYFKEKSRIAATLQRVGYALCGTGTALWVCRTRG